MNIVVRQMTLEYLASLDMHIHLRVTQARAKELSSLTTMTKKV